MKQLANKELNELEKIIEEGISEFLQVGYALLRIRDQNLYLPNFPDFETYYQKRWGYTQFQIESRLASALISETIVSDQKPKYIQHFKVLEEVEDVSLRNKIWDEAIARYGNPTTKEIKRLVNKYENLNPFFLQLTKAGIITSNQAAKLSEELKDLPEKYMESFKLFGFTEDKCIETGIFTKMFQISHSESQTINDALMSGGLYVHETYIYLYDLTMSDLVKLHNKIISEKIKLKQDKAKQKQEDISELIYGSTAYNGLGSWNVVVPQELSLKDLDKILTLEDAKPFAVIVYKNGTKVKNGNKEIEMENCNIFPQDLLESIKEHIC